MIVGLVGGIGAGKSTVARLFGELGAEVIDADAIAHEVLETPRVRRALESRLGESFLGPDGTVDRKALADRVFSSPSDLKALESLIHPEVTRRITVMIGDPVMIGARKAGANEKAGPGGLVILDVPLLVTSPLRDLCDEILFVDADPETRRKRVAERGWAPGELERREGRQADLEAKRSLADRIVDNSGTLEETRARVEKLHSLWMASELR